MWYLVGEISVYLVLAASLGFTTGWLLKGYYKKRDIAYLEKIWKANFYSQEEELKQLRQKIARLETTGTEEERGG